MWSLIPARWQVSLIAGAGFVLAWAIQGVWAFFAGEQVGTLKAISIAATVIVAALVPLLDWLWPRVWDRWPAIGKWTFPNLNGEWSGHVRPADLDPTTRQRWPDAPCTLVIRQKLLATTISMKTRESTSHSTRSLLEAFRDTGRFRVWYTYNNDPQAQVRHRSSPHEGVAWLEIEPATDGGKLVGRYYTDRKSSGDIELMWVGPGRSRTGGRSRRLSPWPNQSVLRVAQQVIGLARRRG